MFLHIVRSPGLAHLSYVVGDEGQAAVIDPRRDVDVYLHLARQRNLRITHIFETHHNEDYLIGSRDLARFNGARIYHGANLPFQYGDPVGEGDRFQIGNLLLSILDTPGHTYESLSITLADTTFSQEPIGVFTGDALFVGDVGRTDFYPDQRQAMADLLYDSLFNKILPLGDHVILYPAHGGGAVCGGHIADREFSTLGYERRHNPVLQKRDRGEFLRYKTNEHFDLPPYFSRMERLNREGPPILNGLPRPALFTAEQFEESMAEGMVAVDVRSPEAFGGAHLPESLSIPLDLLPVFAGWLLTYDRPIGLVVDSPDQVEPAIRYLIRVGFENVLGFLGGGLREWAAGGRKFESIPHVHVADLIRRLNRDGNLTVLDVRTRNEFAQGHLPGAMNLYVGELPRRFNEIPRDRPVVTICSTGQRATMAASILHCNGFEAVENCLGSMQACANIGCPMETSREPEWSAAEI